MKQTFIVLALLLLTACKHDLSQSEMNNAELGAREYSQSAGMEFVSCSGQDSNNDGYVTCTAKKSDQSLVEIVCSYEGSSKGCKLK